MNISVVEIEPFCNVASSVKEEGVVELLTATGILLADLGNGDLAAVEGRVGVAVSKEGNDHNEKWSRQGCGMRLYECGE